MTDRGVAPVVGKALEIGLVLLYVSLLATALYGSAVPGYRTTAGDAVADRTLAAAAQRIEAAVPPGANASVERRVSLPATIRGREYRIRVENETLVLDHPHDGVAARQRLVVPPSVARVEGNWTGGDAVVAVSGGPNGSVVTLREGRG